MKVVDIATEIYINVGSPTSTSIPAIVYWIRSKVGTINNSLYEDFVIDPVTYEILDGSGAEISADAVAIIQKFYEVYDLDVQIRTQMNALASDSLLEFTEVDGSHFRRTNRNEISKTLASIKKDELQRLKDLINGYRIHKAVPAQVTGDDTVEGIFDPHTAFRRSTLTK
jgi:hypothetical protein